MWRVEDKIPQYLPREPTDTKMSDGTIILPSDSEWRPDIAPMLSKDWEEAEKHKVEMEELQRHDAKLRKAAQKANKGQSSSNGPIE